MNGGYVLTVALLWICSLADVSEAKVRVSFRDGLDIDTEIIEDSKDAINARAPETDGSQSDDQGLEKAVKQLAMYRKAIVIDCEPSSYYTIDGKCNNLENPLWGAAFEIFQRVLDNQYTDGKLIPRLYARGTNNTVLLPSAREVTLKCVPSVEEERPSNLHPKHNQNLMQFGQFFSHDLGLTPITEGFNCCKGLDHNGLHPDTFIGGACFPIPIPDNDPRFNDCMVFNRSVSVMDKNGIAQQFSSATHFIDQSTVYGSTVQFANSIRTFKHGLLRTDHFGMLPQDNTQKCFLSKPLDGCPVAGDNRLSVFPGLTTTHLIFHLEHNRVAKELRQRHPQWSDERLYQEARKIVIAETQNLVYQEYLPEILNRRVMRFFGLRKKASYNSTLNPGIINAFQTAALRFGHSQINNMFLLDPDKGQLEFLKNLYFRPNKLFNNGTPIFGELILSLMTHRGQKVDNLFAEGVRDDLFLGVDASGHSTDLPARNIQRGRDHGLPPYKDYLDLVLREFGSDEKLLGKLLFPTCSANLYRSLDDIDLFLGGMFEKLLPGAEMGPVFAYLIGKQFKSLREGDRLFFDTEGSQAGFSKAQIRSIKQTRYSGIICRNAGLEKIPRNAFRIPSDKNPMVDCGSIEDVNFRLW